MSRAQLVPVATIELAAGEQVRVPDFLNASYVDRIRKLVIDQTYELQAGDIGYPDLLSSRLYGTIDYWWILCMYNGCVDPLTDMVAGAKWSIPTSDSIQNLVSNQAGTRSNRVGSAVVI